MPLPITKSEKILDLNKQVILIYGRAKIGKSTLCSMFPKPIFLATESGLNYLEVFKVNCNNWETFLNACKELSEGKHEFETIVIDTIDNLVLYCSEYVCRENGVNHPSEMPHGKGWHLVTSELRRVLTKLASMPQGLVMVSHSMQEEIETKTKKYNRWTISISGKNKNIFLNMVDMILFIDSKIETDGEERRIIRTKPSMNWESGDRSGLLPAELPLDYNALANCFKKGVKDGK